MRQIAVQAAKIQNCDPDERSGEPICEAGIDSTATLEGKNHPRQANTEHLLKIAHGGERKNRHCNNPCFLLFYKILQWIFFLYLL